jgi:aminopeptidase N
VAGVLEPSLFLALAQAYRGEDHPSVWSDLSVNLRALEGLLLEESCLPRFRAFARNLLLEAGTRVGWDPAPDEGHLIRLLRATVLGQLGHYGHPETLRVALERFQSYLKAPSSLHPDLRGVALNLSAQEGDQDTFDTLLGLYREASLHEEKMRLLRALARFRRVDLLQRALDLSLGDDVRFQDTVLLVMAVGANSLGRDMTWEFIKANWAELDRRYGAGGFIISRLVTVTGGFTSLDRADDVEAFFQEHPTPAVTRTVQQSLERIRLNARWREVNAPKVEQWLAERA